MFPIAMKRATLLQGDTVDVLSLAEIAATLDDNGRLDGLPFMPEMVRHCGGRFKIHRRADKTCVEGLGLRRLTDTVLLENLRCDGADHDGCQRGCMMFWKEAWLKKVTPGADTRADVITRAAAPRLPTRNGRLYVCQSTALAECSHDIPSWDISHLVREVVNGELTLVHFAKIVVLAGINKIRVALKLSEIGTLAGSNRKNSKGDLSLEPGERVAVKTPSEIKATLDPTGRNAGLTFEPDMALCVGHEYEVDRPVQRIILEQTGEMRELTHTVTLKGVVCSGLCAKNCPRANPIFWRESWLKRIDAEPGASSAAAPSKTERETVSA